MENPKYSNSCEKDEREKIGRKQNELSAWSDLATQFYHSLFYWFIDVK